jgi:hypothetical protein
MRYLMMTIVFTMVLAACGDAADGGGDDADSAPTASVTDSTTTITRSEEPSDENDLLEPELAAETAGGVVADAVPEELMAKIIGDVFSRAGAGAADMTTVRAERAVWNDGSLGCAIPGESYTQAIVNGYWIVIELAGESYDYRASLTGFFKLCESAGRPPTNPPGS